MSLNIYIDEHISESFIKYVIEQIKLQGMGYLYDYKDKTEKLDNFIKEHFNYKKDISSIDILMSGLNHLVYSQTEQMYIIEIDNAVMSEIPNVRLHTLIQLISDGNLSVKGIPLFKDVYTNVANNILSIYRMYELIEQRLG